MNKIDAKLLLIMPPQPGLLIGFAAGLISLANYVSKKLPQIKTDIIDLSALSLAEAHKKVFKLCSSNPSQELFVGITTTTASYQSALRIAYMVKRAEPNAVLILGGHHASADAETILSAHEKVIDVIITGEGELSLSQLLLNYPDLSTVKGASYFDNGKFVHNAPQILLSQKELDSIPITYGDNGLIGTPGKFNHVTYISARGCPLKCAFCAVGNEKIRYKSIDVVMQDIEKLLNLGFTRIAIEDNFFAHSSARTKSICQAIADLKKRHNIDFSWDCQTRIESLKRKNTIRYLSEAGCEAVYIGVESFHSDQLLYLNKTTNPILYTKSLINNVIPDLLKSNIKIYLNLQFGLPGETILHEQKTFCILASLGKLASSKGKTITIFPQLHVVYPGTTHFLQGVSQRKFPTYVFESFTKWEFEQAPVLYWLGEHFAHGTGGIPEGILKPNMLKDGQYEIDSQAVFKISGALRSIDRLPGIQTFHYGNYIITNAINDSYNREFDYSGVSR